MTGIQLHNIYCLATELIYDILFHLDDIYIMNYCSTHKEARKIWNDNIFWLNKLDYDLSNGVQIPSHYIRDYQQHMIDSYDKHSRYIYEARDIYKRWKDFKCLDSTKKINHRNLDVIVFTLDKLNDKLNDRLNDRLNDITDDIGTALLCFSIINGYLEILLRLAKRNITPNINEVNTLAGNGYLHILHWLEQVNNIFPTTIGANFALLNDRHHVLQWLQQRHILPSRCSKFRSNVQPSRSPRFTRTQKNSPNNSWS